MLLRVPMVCVMVLRVVLWFSCGAVACLFDYCAMVVRCVVWLSCAAIQFYYDVCVRLSC